MLKQAEVVCATCVGVGSDQLKPLSFPCVLLDEATLTLTLTLTLILTLPLALTRRAAGRRP